SAGGVITLDHEPLELQHRYYVRSGMKLVIGSRPFKILIAPNTTDIGRDFSFADFSNRIE
ncbi:MAG: hypothetical protein AABZ55_07850, partial [Bdellovibrionota bacterium]